MQEKKYAKDLAAFIIYYDEERYLEECLYYIERLQIPYGVKAEIIPMKGKTEFAECYSEAEKKSDAEYKVYLDQHTLIVNDLFLYDLLMEFEKNPEADAIGILGGDGAGNINRGRVLIWDERGITDFNYQRSAISERVYEVSNMLTAIRYSGKGGREEGTLYQYALVPYQNAAWCIYDCCDDGSDAEEEYRFMVGRAGNCRDVSAAASVELLLNHGRLSYEEHRKYAEKNALGKGSFAGYFWEDSLLIERKWKKYLRANGRVSLEDRARSEMHVVLAFNHKYAVYAAVMLQSLYDNNPLCRIHVHVLQSELTAEDKRGLAKQAGTSHNRISFYAVDRSVLPQGAPVTQEWSAEAYFRLFMQEILPEEVNRILYLDVDIIVNKPIYDFYFMDMKEYDIVGCRDFSMILKEDFQDKRKELFAAVKDDEDFTYINSGVMLVDLSALREKVCSGDYLKVIQEQKGRLLAPDQDVINLVHWKKTGLVDEYRYDFFNGCFKGVGADEVKQYVSIIHYAGAKPWAVKDIGMHAHRIWWEYAVKTEMAQKLIYETICREKKLILEQENLIKGMQLNMDGCGRV